MAYNNNRFPTVAFSPPPPPPSQSLASLEYHRLVVEISRGGKKDAPADLDHVPSKSVDDLRTFRKHVRHDLKHYNSTIGFIKSFKNTHNAMAPLERYSLNMAGPPARQVNIDGNNKPSRGIRYATDPLLASQQKKENVAPAAGLLRPISPTQTRLHTLPKSRTISTMQRLTSTLSRSNLNLVHISSGRKSSLSSAALAHIGLSSSKSTNSLVTAAPTTALSNITVQTSTTTSVQKRIPIPKSPLGLLDVYEAMPSAYWSGRLQSLYDRYGTEMIQETIDNPVVFARCVAPTPKGFAPPSHLKGKPKEGIAKVPIEDTIDTERHESSLFLDDQSDGRYIKAFSSLRLYCKRDEAAQSLWEFQQRFARKEKKAALLPLGGTMGGWRGILTKGRKSERDSERGTSLGLGRRTGLSRTFAKRAGEGGLGETF